MVLTRERWKAFTRRQRPLLLSPLFNTVLEVLANAIRQQQQQNNKRHPDWKERRKTILFIDGMILNI